jgi:hypothetical protein
MRARPRELYNKSNDDNSRGAREPEIGLPLWIFGLGVASHSRRRISPGVRNIRKMHRRPLRMHFWCTRDVCNRRRRWDNNATHKSLAQSKQKILDFHSSR